MAEENKSSVIKPVSSGISFAFSKKKDVKVIEKLKQLPDDDPKAKLEVDFVISLEGKELKSVNQKEEKKPLVIPLIKNKSWRLRAPEELYSDTAVDDKKPENDSKTDPAEKAYTSNTLESIAAREIIEAAKHFHEDPDAVDRAQLKICLNDQQGISENDRTADDWSKVVEADYGEVPIEQFGVALLRGMGWQEGRGIGRQHKQAVTPVEAVIRPKGLGLGADKSVALQKAGNLKNQDTEKNEDVQLKKGSFCVFLNGKHKDLYGEVKGIDEDNSRVMVKLRLSGQIVNVPQISIQTVSKKDYEKNSKVLNKSKVDKYREERRKIKHKKDRNSSDSESDKDRKHSQKSNRSDSGLESDYHHHRHHHHHHHHHHHRHSSPTDQGEKASKYQYVSDKDSLRDKHGRHSSDTKHTDCKEDKYLDHKKDKSRHKRDIDSCEDSDSKDRRKNGPDSKKKRRYDIMENEDRNIDKQKKSSSLNGGSSKRSWLHQQLRVRVIDKNYKKGKYYKTKVVIEDVVKPEVCICRTDDGKLLEDIHQSMLETVIPKSENSHVYIVDGPHRSQLAEILQKDKQAYRATVQLLRDRGEVLDLDYNDICEYCGDVTAELDY